MRRIRKILACIGGAIVVFFAGVASVLFFSKKKKDTPYADEAKRIEEASREEIENTSPAALVDSADNSGELRASIANIKGDFRERVRNRLGESVRRNGSSGDAANTDRRSREVDRGGV